METPKPGQIPYDCEPSIAAIIPTFRRPEMLQALLISLRKGSRVPDEVIVVDNDPEASAAPQAIPGLKVRVISAGLGMSVAGARNVGWREATADVVVFIDDDNVVDADAIASLARVFESGDVGLAAPVIYAGDSGSIWCAGVSRSRWTGQTHKLLQGKSELPSQPSWPTDDMPDMFAVPRVVLEKLEGFDERRFPLYYEEADLGARIRAAGWRAIVVRDATVQHHGWVGFSPGGELIRATASHGQKRARQMVVSRIRFHMLHSRGLERLTIVGIFIPVWLLITSFACLPVKAPWKLRLETIRAIGTAAVGGYREILAGSGSMA